MDTEKVAKLAIPLGVLLAGAGIFYHYVFFLPNIEKAKQAQLEAEKAAHEQKAAQRALQYELCNQGARAAYEANWSSACKSNAEDRKLNYENCLKDPSVMGNEFLGKQYCIRTYGKIDPSPDCTLPRARADDINQTLKDAQQRCLMESKSDL